MKNILIKKWNKKAVSNIIGYLLLVAIVIVISMIVYQWLKTYVPTDAIQCDEGVSIGIDDYNYDCEDNALNLTIKNSGRFSTGGYYIYGTTSESEDIATQDLSPYTSLGSEGLVLFDESVNAISPGTKISNFFSINNSNITRVYLIELIPVRYQEVNNKNMIVNCGESRIRQTLTCSANITAVCGNNIKETGETCDGTDLNLQTCLTQGFTGGTLSCSGNCLSFNTAQCTSITCGDGTIGAGELCDDSNTNSSDGCSSVCQVEFGYTCAGTPSVCTGFGVFNATYRNLSKDTGSNPDPNNCHPNQGCHWWYFTSTLSETGGTTGITVNSRQKCYVSSQSSFCDPIRTSFSGFGTNIINNGSQITWSNNYIYTNAPPLTLTETFNGTDDNSNFVTTNYTFTVSAL